MSILLEKKQMEAGVSIKLFIIKILLTRIRTHLEILVFSWLNSIQFNSIQKEAKTQILVSFLRKQQVFKVIKRKR